MAENPVLDKIRKLINLASSSNLKEAERAAYKACALIRNHGLDIADPTEIDGIYQEQATLQQKVAQLEAAKPAGDSFQQQLDQMLWWTTPPFVPPPRPSGQGPSGQFVVPTVLKGRGGPPPVMPNVLDSVMDAPREIASRFAGQCKQCRKAHDIGSPVLWRRGVYKGVWCSTPCYMDWRARQNAFAGITFDNS